MLLAALYSMVASSVKTHAAYRIDHSHLWAGQLAGLRYPSGELNFVELLLLLNIEVAQFVLLGLPGDTGGSDAPAASSQPTGGRGLRGESVKRDQLRRQ